MKKRKLTFLITFITVCFILFSFTNKEENLIRYFINPDLGTTNWRSFESNKGSVDNVTFKQIIKQSNDDNGVIMEYYFLTPDSIPFLGGIENINRDEVRIIDQFIYLDNRKIQASKITPEAWKPLSESGKKITTEFFDKKTGFGFKTTSIAYSRIKDTLNKNSFIVEFESKTLYLRDGKIFDEILSETKRIYVKDKGLLFYSETINGNKIDYHLIE